MPTRVKANVRPVLTGTSLREGLGVLDHGDRPPGGVVVVEDAAVERGRRAAGTGDWGSLRYMLSRAARQWRHARSGCGASRMPA